MRVIVSATEASADRLAAEVLAFRPDWECRGVVGPSLSALGVRPLAEMYSAMGTVEVFGAAGRIARAAWALRAAIEEGADLFLAVDAPDFNIPMARQARKAGIPVVFLGSPQVWAWRRERATEIAELGRVLCLLPFEPQYYPPGKAVFVGHPVVDRCPPLGPPPDGALAVLPGSRKAELQRLLPDLREAVRRVGGGVRLAVAPGVDPKEFDGMDVILCGSVREAVEPARAVLTASGTATLELACHGRPMAVCYKVSPVTYAVGKALVDGVKHIALPNIILGREAVPELLQDFGPGELVEAWLGVGAEQMLDLALVRTALGPPGAAQRAAEALWPT